MMRSSLSLCVVASSIALSSCVTNPALDYAAQGKNQMLLETTQQQEIKSTADQHQLCYALLQTKRYDPLVTCLNELERRIQAGQKRTRLFGLDDATPAVWIMRAEMELELGHPANALAEAEKAYQWIQKTRENDRWVLLSILSVATLAAQRAKDTEKAQRYLQELEQVSVAYPLYHNHATTKSLALARAYMSTRQYDKVLQALQSDSSFEWRAAVMNVFSSSQEDRWAWQRLPRLYMMMRALQETGATDEALRGYRQLLAHPSLPDNFEIHWRTLAETATLTEKSGNTDEATTLYKKAIDLLELYRGNVDTEINKVGELVDRKSLYDRYIALLLRKKESIQALEITERKNGFIVVNALAEKTIFKSSQESTDAATQQAITNLIQTEKAARIQDNSSSMATVSVRREEIKAAQKQIDKVVDPETASLVKVPNYNQNIIKKYLERGESVLIFHVDKNTGLGASWLWLPGREKPINRQFDYAKVMKWLELIREEFSFLSDPKNIKKNSEINQRQDAINPLLQNIYTALIGNQIEDLKIRRMTIIPQGDLHYLPFYALRHKKGEYLGDLALVRIIPNMDTMRFLESKPQVPPDNRSLIMQYDEKGDIKNTEREVQTIAGILPKSSLQLSFDATEARFKRDTQHVRYIHLAAHGFFDQKDSMNSHIRLRGGEGDDGKLTVKELYDVRLNTELFTMSACTTAQGYLSDDGADVVGLVKGGFKAGSRYVIASLWNVEDKPTAILMENFYRSYATGKDNAAALQEAQRLVRQRYPHPYFWAAMQIYG